MIPLLFASERFAVIGRSALFWPAQKALVVADLHLEKASFYARQGQMLPPYDSRSTLERIGALASETGARRLFCLGDNYHDCDGENRLDERSCELLRTLTDRLDWHWIVGNHDPDIGGRHGGHVHREYVADGIALRHISEPGGALPDISGHYHPKLRLRVHRTHVSRPCFVAGKRHLIMPAFGALTGGMSAFDPIIADAVGGAGEAVVPAGQRLARFALPASTAEKAQGQFTLALTG